MTRREPAYWIWDGTHPTEAGHALICRTVFSGIQRRFSDTRLLYSPVRRRSCEAVGWSRGRTPAADILHFPKNPVMTVPLPACMRQIAVFRIKSEGLVRVHGLGRRQGSGPKTDFRSRRGFVVAGKDRPAMSAAALGQKKPRPVFPLLQSKKISAAAQRFSRRKYEIYGNAISSVRIWKKRLRNLTRSVPKAFGCENGAGADFRL